MGRSAFGVHLDNEQRQSKSTKTAFDKAGIVTQAT